MGSVTDLNGAVVVITGAGSGIGRALAVQAGARGARLALSDTDPDGLAETVALAEEAGSPTVAAGHLDVGDRAAFTAYAAEVASRFGRVDVVVNNAGVSHSGPVTEMEYADFDWLMNTNFWGVVHGTREFLPHLIASGAGHLVNISSLFGLVSMPGQSTYNAAKYAVRGFTESVRQDMLLAGHPVRVTCVHPGGVKTGIARNGRVTRGQDQAALASHFDTRLARMTPERAAQIIWFGALRGRPRVLVGADAHAVHQFAKLLGARYQDVFTRIAGRMI